MIDNDTAVAQMLAAKAAVGLTYAQIAERVGHAPVWVASALHGQQSMGAADAALLGEVLALSAEVVALLQTYREKGHLATVPPIDPLLYRLHEINLVYGTAMKALITEEFGDGIMSAIDFRMDITRKADPAGDRVVITLDGKFLPYRVF